MANRRESGGNRLPSQVPPIGGAGQPARARLLQHDTSMLKLGMCGFTIAAAAYYRRFRVVEVQQTFYDPPPIATLMRWRAEAPPDFEFTMKAWQVITHFGSSTTYRRLRSSFPDHARAEAGGFRLNDTVFAAWLTTLECAHLLRATAILFQCPASFRPTTDNVDAMRDFFLHVDRPSGVRFLWEPRGEWPDDMVLALCRELRLIHAVDPFIRPTLTPEVIYWRLHGNRSPLRKLHGRRVATDPRLAAQRHAGRVCDVQ